MIEFIEGRMLALEDKEKELHRNLPSEVEAVVSINGVEQELATGAEVLGTPLESIRWLAGKLAGFGRRLEAGTLVMSGSFTRQYDIAKGDRVETAFRPFGTATAQFD